MVSNKKFIFNYAATFWSIIANYIFLPLYLKYLGAEWYGILSVGIILQSVLILFNAGLSSTLSREFAANNLNEQRTKLLYTLEKLLLLTMSVASIIFFSLIPFVVEYWLNIEPQNITKAILALRLFIFVIVAQILFFFYLGGLWGLDKQEEASVMKILFSIFKAGFVIFILIYSPSIISFLLFQISVSVFFVWAIRARLLKRIVTVKNDFSFFTTFDKSLIKENQNFALGMFLISVISVLNYQTDKIILSSLLPIEILGFYNLAFLLCQTPVSASSPIGTSLFPKLTSLGVSGNNEDLSIMVKEGYRMILILSLGIGLTIIFANTQIITLWTGSEAAADATTGLLPFLVVGGILQSWQIVPFNMAIAKKEPKIILVMATFNLIFTIPLYYFLIKKMGVIGAGVTWAIFNSISTPVFIIFIFRRYFGMSFCFEIIKDIFQIAAVNFIAIGGLFFIFFTLIGVQNNLFVYGLIIIIGVLLSLFLFIRHRMFLIFSTLKLALSK